MSHDQAGFEHKRLLLQLSEKLTQDESNKIVYLVEEMPKKLLDRSPWEVFAHLEMLGKTSPEELTRILKGINRPDVAKKVKEGKARRAPLTRKDSGSSALKLEESLTLAIKNCEVLLEQLDYLKLGASKGRKKRMEEVVSEAKESLCSLVHRKLKYISGFLSQENEQRAILTVSTSPTSSPESSITSLKSPDSPPSPVRLTGAAVVNERELRRAHENLKPSKQRGTSSSVAQSSSDASTVTVLYPSHVATKQHEPTHIRVIGGAAKQPVDNCDDENIYTLPGPLVASSGSGVNDRMYYNCMPSRPDVNPPLSSASSDKQASETTSLVTGSSEAAKLAVKKLPPVPPPKPKKKPQKVEKPDDNSSLTDDYSGTFTSDSTGNDSGFSDSKKFRKDPPPITSPQITPTLREKVTDPDSTYATLIQSEVQPAAYYKSTNKQKRIPDVVYKDTSGL